MQLYSPDILVDVFELGKIQQRIIAMQSTQAAFAVTTSIRLSEQFVVVVNPHGAIAQCPGNTQGACTVMRPNASGQTEFRMIGTPDGLGLVFEGLQYQQRAEDFLLAKKRAT